MTRAIAVATCASLVLASCGGPPPPRLSGESAGSVSSSPLSPRAAKVAPDAPMPAAVAPARGPRVGIYSHLWTAETKDWNGGLLLTSEGDVLAFSTGGIRVLARDDGRDLHQASGCAPVSVDGVAFVGGDRFVVACDDELREFSWPDLGSKRIVRFARRVNRAAVTGRLAAVAEAHVFAADEVGRVVVHDARDGRVLDELVVPAEVEALALARDGSKLFVGTREAGIFLRDLRSRATERWSAKGDGDGASFAPDGKSIFGDFAAFRASIVELATKTTTRTWPVGSWLTASRWIDDQVVATTGSDGLVILGADGEPAAAPVSELGEGIALSDDRGTLCAGGRSGRIACFGRSKPAPTTLGAVFASGRGRPTSDPGSDPARPVAPEIEAKILGRKGKLVELSVDPGTPIAPGSTGTLSKPFRTDVGILLSGWVVIAEVKVASAARGRVTLEILQEKSAMTVNGRPVNHFAPGEGRLALTPPP